MNANCSFKIASWDETPCVELEGGAKLTRAQVTQTYSGDLLGESRVEFLMSHGSDGTAQFVGYELLSGTLAGKQGSFILQHVGTYGSRGAESQWSIQAGSGTGDLAGIHGKGSYAATGESVEMPFSYGFDS